MGHLLVKGMLPLVVLNLFLKAVAIWYMKPKGEEPTIYLSNSLTSHKAGIPQTPLSRTHQAILWLETRATLSLSGTIPTVS